MAHILINSFKAALLKMTQETAMLPFYVKIKFSMEQCGCSLFWFIPTAPKPSPNYIRTPGSDQGYTFCP